MQSLITIFGSIVSIFFTTEGGASISEVSRVQAENKQKNDSFWSLVKDATASVFKRSFTFVGAGPSGTQAVPGITITPESLLGYSDVANRSAHTTTLMHGLKLWKKLQSTLEKMDLRLHVVAELPSAPPQPTSVSLATTCNTDSFMELTNIEEMIAVLKDEVLAKFNFGFWRKANELNSRAAALGKLLSADGAFFRELVKPLPRGGEQLVQAGVLITSWERHYAPEAALNFATQREVLQAEYNSLQQQLNGLRKQIKDAVREFNLAEVQRYEAEYSIYQVTARQYTLEMERIRAASETLRQQALTELAALRVRTEQ